MKVHIHVKFSKKHINQAMEYTNTFFKVKFVTGHIGLYNKLTDVCECDINFKQIRGINIKLTYFLF